MDDIKQHIADVEEMYQNQLALSEELEAIIKKLEQLGGSIGSIAPAIDEK